MTDASAPSAPPPPSPPARRPSTASLLLMLVVTSAAVGWYWFAHRPAPVDPVAPTAVAPAPASVDPALLNRLERLETTLSDLERVNSVLRQQVVALTERTRVQGEQLELQGRERSAQARTADPADSALLRADLWLSLAQGRQDLYADSSGALQALAQADAALAVGRDPRIPALRQTLAIEIEALRRDPVLDATRIAGQLDAWKQALPGWPRRSASADQNATDGVLDRLDRYFQVRPIAQAVVDSEDDTPLQAELAWARVLLARGERAALLASLQRLSQAIETRFDADHPPVHAALEGIETLVEQLRSSVAGPALGNTLQELRAVLEAPRSGPAIQTDPVPSNRPSVTAEAPASPVADAPPLEATVPAFDAPAPAPVAADEPADGAPPP